MGGVQGGDLGGAGGGGLHAPKSKHWINAGSLYPPLPSL